MVPVLQEWRKISDVEIYLSYFSPSVPKVNRDWSFASYCDYLPLDSPRDVAKFLSIVRPQMLILNRYDLWPNLLASAKEREIPIVLVNASTPPLSWIGRIGLWLRRPLFAWISDWTFVDSVAAGEWEVFMGESAKGLVTGNPRVDRSIARALNTETSPPEVRWVRECWLQTGPSCIVAGSTWQKDEALLLAVFARLETESWQLVLVPHEPSAEHVIRLRREIAQFGLEADLLSERMNSTQLQSLASDSHKRSSILIVDAVGVLSELYALADTAYVGGGFGRSVHSIIEPAAHRLPVAFGPKHARMPEARTLELIGGAFCVPSGSAASIDLLADWFRATVPGGQKAAKTRESIELFLQIHRRAGERVALFLEERLRR